MSGFEGYVLQSVYSANLIPIWVYLVDDKGELLGMCQLRQESLDEANAIPANSSELAQAIGTGLTLMREGDDDVTLDTLLSMASVYFVRSQTFQKIAQEAGRVGIHGIVRYYPGQVVRPFATVRAGDEPISPETVLALAARAEEVDQRAHPGWFVKLH
jgi:hypothetical protein